MAQAYNWPLADIRKISMAQLIMLNHAAWVNSERLKSKSKPSTPEQQQPEEPTFKGKKVTELNSDEYMQYLNN